MRRPSYLQRFDVSKSPVLEVSAEGLAFDIGANVRLYNLLSSGAFAMIAVPNLRNVSVIAQRIRGNPWFKTLGNYEASEARPTSLAAVREWCEKANLTVAQVVSVLHPRAQILKGLRMESLTSWFAKELIVAARKA
jgi:hypothetical protein